MLFNHLLLLSAFGTACCVQVCEYDDPRVFAPLFYLNNHPDIEQAGIHTTEAAATHWCNNGVSEGRQGSSVFHSKQYIARYPDLGEFGSDYGLAVIHYLETGLSEGRVGFLEGGGEGRWTVRSPQEVEGSHVYLSTSSRVAGAIDSLVWRDKEFINGWDHGRQLQCAITVNSWGECWNPTEAGGRDDGIGKTTKSEVIFIEAQNGSLATSNLPAYWIRAGHKTSIPSGDNCQPGDESFNEGDTHQGTIDKVVTLGCFGLDNCIKFEIVASLGPEEEQPPFGWRFAQLEGPTAYLGHDFSGISYFNLTSGSLVGERSEAEKCDMPPVIHTPDQEYALGVISAPREAATGFPRLCYAYFSFHMTQWDQKTYKWSVVVRQEPEAGSLIEVTSYLCVGTLQMVADCLRDVAAHI